MTPYYEHAGITIYHGDCRDVLPGLEAEVCITDPPYNVGKVYGGEYDDNWATSDWIEWLGSRFAVCDAPEVIYFPGHVELFSAPEIAIRSSRQIRRVLGWHKREFAGDLWTSGPAISWEPIVWMGKADKGAFNKLFGTNGRDFLVVNSVHGNPYKGPHPCPKPVQVMRWLVGLFSSGSGLVVDPFCGTGTTLKACKDANRSAIGIEIEERYCEIAAKRLSQEVLDLAEASA